MKQLAAVENRNAMLEYQLREMRFQQKNMRVATAAAPSLVSVEDQIDKLIDTSSSSEIDDKCPQAHVHGVIPKPSSPVIGYTGHFMSDVQTDVDNAAFSAWPTTTPQQMSLGNASITAQFSPIMFICSDMEDDIRNVMSFETFFIHCQQDQAKLRSLEEVSIHIHEQKHDKRKLRLICGECGGVYLYTRVVP